MAKRSVENNSKKRSVNPLKPETSKVDKGTKYFRAIVAFVIGTVFGLYVVSWFVTLLPGPKVMATVYGYRGTSANTKGCVYYFISVLSEEPIEYTYLKVQFPGKINNFKVGLPQEAQTATAGKMAMYGGVEGKDANGDCIIKQVFISNSEDVQSSAVGNMLAIHASKLPSRSVIMGMIATNEGESSVKPIPTDIYTEGAYEYLTLGQTVRKTLSVSNTGISDAK